MTNDCDLSWYLYICISGLYEQWSGGCEQWLVAGRLVVVLVTLSVKFLQSWREVRSDREISWPLRTGTLWHNNKQTGLAWISQRALIAR